jgi:N6-L-threonylcarbamoyladenine synthase
LVAAKALCVALDKPLVAVNHLQAHIYACRIAAAPDEVFPCVGLIVSGGHTSLYRCLGPLDFELLGATIDDAAGEAFDKVAAMLGLSYPGGPSIQRAAERGNAKAYPLPRAFYQEDDRLDFSFSGLKTAVRYRIAGPGRPDLTQIQLDAQQVADLAASFQEAVVDSLVDKAFAALRRTGLHVLCVGGGVAANARLRQRLQEEADSRNVQLHIAPLRLCTDNAIMGAIAIERLEAGLTEGLDLEVYPGVVRGR